MIISTLRQLRWGILTHLNAHKTLSGNYLHSTCEQTQIGLHLLRIIILFLQNILRFHKIFIHLQSQIQREAKLRYGVMVALQILALSVRVRVLLSQQSSTT